MKPCTKSQLSKKLEWSIVLVAAAILVAVSVVAYPTGPPPGVTGGFGERTCDQAGCHNSFELNAGRTLGLGGATISGLPTQYEPGRIYPVTVTNTHTQGRQAWGFQLAARAEATGAQAGELRPTDSNTQVLVENGIQYIEQTRAGTFFNVFTFNWVAPSSSTGTIVMHAASNAANGDLVPSGDYISTASITTSPVGVSAPPPQISSGGVVGAGLSNPLVRQISPNGIISIFGQNFAPAGTARLVGGSDLVDGKLPTNFANLCVQVGSARAPFFFVSERQLNVQVPSIADRGTISVRVIQNCGQPNELQSNGETLTIQAMAPEFFFFKQNPDGKNPIAALNAITNDRIGATNLIAGVTFAPAKPDDILTLFSTGLGATNSPVQAGVLPSGAASTVEPVTVTIGSLNAEVLYAGVAPGFAGLYQINIKIPRATPDGDLAVTARIGGLSTPPGAFITVKN